MRTSHQPVKRTIQARRLRSIALGAPAVLAPLSLVGCGGDSPSSPDPSPGEPTLPDVVVIVLDTTRQDGLPIYGYEGLELPTLDALAKRSRVFTNAWSSSSWTAPATASILSGLYPHQHGVELGFLASLEQSGDVLTEVTMAHIPGGLSILPEALSEAGYETFGIADNLNVSAELGFTDGFDYFVNTHREAIDAGRWQYAGIEHVAEVVEEMAPDFRAAAPGFFYLHLMDPHGPYGEREPWYDLPPDADLLTQGRGRYDSELAYLDHHLAGILAALEADEDTLIVVVSDHGEEFLDHGGLDHGFQLYAELTRAVLFIQLPASSRSPERLEASGTDDRLASVVDVLPTIRGALGLEPEPRLAGIDLFATPARPDRVVLSRRRAGLDPEDQTIHAIVSDDRHLIVDSSGRRPLLFDTVADPREQHDLFTAEADAAERLRERLLAIEAEGSPEPHERVVVDLDAGTIASLEVLGYVEDE